MFLNIFDYYNADYSFLTKEIFENWRITAGFLTGIINFCITFPIYKNAQTIAVKKCRQSYPNEQVLLVVKSGFWLSSICTFLCGAFLGVFALPFLFFKNITYINGINYFYYFCIYTFVYFISIIFIIIRFSMIYIITDLGIRFIKPYKIQNFLLQKKIFIPFTNIRSCYYERFLWFNGLIVNLKDNTRFTGMSHFAKLKNVSLLINSKIGKEN